MAKADTSSKVDWGRDLGEPIAVLRLEPGQLKRRRNIEFRSGYDDLDELCIASIETREGARFALVRHVHAPKPGTEVVALAPPKHVSRDIASVLEVLNLTDKDVAWKRPAAKSPSGNRAKRNKRSVETTGDVSRATDAKFTEIIERSRAGARAQGAIPLAEIRRKYGPKRRTSTRRRSR